MKSILLQLVLANLLLVFGLNYSFAQLIQNPSFEMGGAIPTRGYIGLDPGNQTITNWMIERGTVDYIGSFWNSSDGNRAIDMNGSSAGTISQAFNTVVGQTYLVSFDLAGNPTCPPESLKRLLVSAGDYTNTFVFDVTSTSLTNMGWVTESFQFTAIAAMTTLRFASQDVGSFCGPAIDNIIIYDCAGTPNGMAVIDSCEVCRETTDPSFNICLDCEGTVNGTAVLDSCGTCLDPLDPDFLIFCPDPNVVYIPNAFSPNGDANNDVLRVFAEEGLITRIRSYLIFDRWGSLIYQENDFGAYGLSGWWNGYVKEDKCELGVYVYLFEIEFSNGAIKLYKGEVSLMK